MNLNLVKCVKQRVMHTQWWLKALNWPEYLINKHVRERGCVKLDAHPDLQSFAGADFTWACRWIKQPSNNAYRQTLKPQQVLTTEKRREVRDIKLPIKPQWTNNIDCWKKQAADIKYSIVCTVGPLLWTPVVLNCWVTLTECI